MSNPFVLVAVCVLIGTVSELLLKHGMTKVGRVGRPEARSPVATLWRVATTPAILIAGVLYVLGLVLWLAVLSQLDLSLAIPILGTSYATVPLAARVLLGERVSPIRWVGIGMIFAGVVLVARS